VLNWCWNSADHQGDIVWLWLSYIRGPNNMEQVIPEPGWKKTLIYFWWNGINVLYLCMKNKETIQEIITDEINGRLTQLIEEMSTNEFVDLICDKVYTEKGIDYTDEMKEEIHLLCGEQVFPLLLKIMEHVTGIPLPEVPN
jgi:hypothetical protein